MTTSASPRQSSFFAPREPRIDDDGGPFDFGWSDVERQRKPAAPKPAKLVMPNSELTAAKSKKPKPHAVPKAPAVSKVSQAGLFDELNRKPAPTVSKNSLDVPSDVELIGDNSVIESTPGRKTGSYAFTASAFVAIAFVAGGLGFVTAPEPEMLTGSIAVAGQAIQSPEASMNAFIMPAAKTVSLPISAALDVGEGFLLKAVLLSLFLILSVFAGFMMLRRLLSPKSSGLHWDDRDQLVDANLVPPSVTGR